MNTLAIWRLRYLPAELAGWRERRHVICDVAPTGANRRFGGGRNVDGRVAVRYSLLCSASAAMCAAVTRLAGGRLAAGVPSRCRHRSPLSADRS